MSKLFRRDSAMALAGSLFVVALFLAEPPRGAISAPAGDVRTVYKWNVADKAQPLLGLSGVRLQAGFAQSLAYPVRGACNA
jgi:hypothetical protein